MCGSARAGKGEGWKDVRPERCDCGSEGVLWERFAVVEALWVCGAGYANGEWGAEQVTLTQPIATLVAAGIVVLGGIASYFVQKWRDRKEQIRARHFDIYVEMVEAICAMGNAHNRGQGIEDALSNYFTAKMKFAVVASEDAMKKFVAFDRLLTSGDQVPNEVFDRSLAEFMRVARFENLGKTKLSDEDLVVVTPFGRSLRNRMPK